MAFSHWLTLIPTLGSIGLYDTSVHTAQSPNQNPVLTNIDSNLLWVGRVWPVWLCHYTCYDVLFVKMPMHFPMHFPPHKPEIEIKIKIRQPCLKLKWTSNKTSQYLLLNRRTTLSIMILWYIRKWRTHQYSVITKD